MEYKAKPSKVDPDAILDPMTDPRTSGLYILYEERVPLVRHHTPLLPCLKDEERLTVRIGLPARDSRSERKEIVYLILLLPQIEEARTSYPVLSHSSHLWEWFQLFPETRWRCSSGLARQRFRAYAPPPPRDQKSQSQ